MFPLRILKPHCRPTVLHCICIIIAIATYTFQALSVRGEKDWQRNVWNWFYSYLAWCQVGINIKNVGLLCLNLIGKKWPKSYYLLRYIHCMHLVSTGPFHTKFSSSFIQVLMTKRAKVYSTRYSQEVSHPSTNRARRCFTSGIGREPVYSTWYGRRRQNTVIFAI